MKNIQFEIFKMTSIRNIIFLFAMLFFHNLFAQSPYEIDWKKEPIYLGIGGVTTGTYFFLHKDFAGLTSEEILDLDRMDVNSFDRKGTFNYSIKANNWSDVFSIGSYALPFALLIPKRTRGDVGTIFLLYGESFLINGGLTGLTKRLSKRPRPFVYNELAPFAKKQLRGARYSFFSGHTSSAAHNSFFAAKIFSDYFPDSKLKPYVWITAATIPAVTGYLRVKAGKHYPTDVMAGYAVGALVGFLVPHLHKKGKDSPLGIIASPNGVSLSWNIK